MNPLTFLANNLGGEGGILGGVTSVIDQFVDDPQEKAKAKAAVMEQERKLEQAIMDYEQKRIEEQSKTIRAEIKGQSWMQRNWRPLLALSFGFIVVNNYILVPYAVSFGLDVPQLEMPGGLWALLTTMIGGYTVGRTWEKRHGQHENAIPEITSKVLQRIGDAGSG